MTGKGESSVFTEQQKQIVSKCQDRPIEYILSSGIYHFLTSKQRSKKQVKKLGGNHENKIYRPKNGYYFRICELPILLFKRCDVILHLRCFFCGSFYVAISTLEFIAMNGRIISE
jgi:hypothetical protein